ncbi:hypothetical protein [Streptomyces siamensis]|uniref:hypothetical protein n=1 Tax=Streptomyces siamensis TaxID=1274986 RepID=UPI0031E647E2
MAANWRSFVFLCRRVEREHGRGMGGAGASATALQYALGGGAVGPRWSFGPGWVCLARP